MTSLATARWVLLAGLAFVFLYFGIEKFVDPFTWIGWMPTWMDGLLGLPVSSWLSIIGGTEILIGVMLIVPMRAMQRTGSFLAVLHLCGILATIGWNDVAVRDVGLLAMAIAVWFMPRY